MHISQQAYFRLATSSPVCFQQRLSSLPSKLAELPALTRGGAASVPGWNYWAALSLSPRTGIFLFLPNHSVGDSLCCLIVRQADVKVTTKGRNKELRRELKKQNFIPLERGRHAVSWLFTVKDGHSQKQDNPVSLKAKKMYKL